MKDKFRRQVIDKEPAEITADTRCGFVFDTFRVGRKARLQSISLPSPI